MAWVDIKSSNINKIKYEDTTNTLSIKFNSGYVYEFIGVEKAVYQSLLKASSKGKFFHQNIKNKHEYKKIM